MCTKSSPLPMCGIPRQPEVYTRWRCPQRLATASRSALGKFAREREIPSQCGLPAGVRAGFELPGLSGVVSACPSSGPTALVEQRFCGTIPQGEPLAALRPDGARPARRTLRRAPSPRFRRREPGRLPPDRVRFFGAEPNCSGWRTRPGSRSPKSVTVSGRRPHPVGAEARARHARSQRLPRPAWRSPPRLRDCACPCPRGLRTALRDDRVPVLTAVLQRVTLRFHPPTI